MVRGESQPNMSYKIFDTKYLANWLTEKQIQTPCYVYDTQLLIDTLCAAQNACKNSFKHGIIHYALKANNNTDLLNIIRPHGFGIDCVSGGEINYALDHNFNAKDLVFAGVGKLDWEINLALERNICAFNCESLEELEVINQLAADKNVIAQIMLRINPDIDAKTHKHISTGQANNKFGISINHIKNSLEQINQLKHIKICGLHYHIGSQITDMQIYATLAQNVTTDYQEMKCLGFDFTHLDLGGGLGIDYANPEQNPIPDFATYFEILANNLVIDDEIIVHFELGRSLIAQCGAILSSVTYIKPASDYDFAIIDAGMNDLIRPALYGAQHKIMSLRPLLDVDHSGHINVDEELRSYCVVGPVCESSDIFSQNVKLPKLKRGDKIALLSCGAYGHVMANQYNLRPLIHEYTLCL